MIGAKISIVTTLYNSSAYVREFIERARAAVRELTDDYEFIVVDDGSPDDSLQIAVGMLDTERNLKVIELSRNFGHHKAMMTGLEHATGDLVFLIDSDLEEPPELLGTFFATLIKDDLDVVYGLQSTRKGGVVERFAGRFAWGLIALMLPVRIPLNHTTIRLMRRDYVNALVRHKENKTAIGGLWVITGFRQQAVRFDKRSRGATTYGVSHKLTALLDSVTSFSERPLFIVFYVGCVVLVVSGIAGVYLIVSRLAGEIPEGWVSLVVSIWFFGGLNVCAIGIVGLYVSRIFIETKHRPYTLIRRIHSHSPQRLPLASSSNSTNTLDVAHAPESEPR